MLLFLRKEPNKEKRNVQPHFNGTLNSDID